jgi:hypothetical protein
VGNLEDNAAVVVAVDDDDDDDEVVGVAMMKYNLNAIKKFLIVFNF